MRVESFFEQGIADSLKASGVQELIPLEIPLGELLASFEARGCWVLDPKAHSNVVRPFIHDGIGRYAVLGNPKDPNNLDLDVLIVVTKVDESGIESCPYIFDTEVGNLQSLLFE